MTDANGKCIQLQYNDENLCKLEGERQCARESENDGMDFSRSMRMRNAMTSKRKQANENKRT